MPLSARRQRTLRGLLLCCAVLLFAAQTLTMAHVHGGDGACVVCPHGQAQQAAGVNPLVLPDQPDRGSELAADSATAPPRSPVIVFDARGPPRSAC